MPTSAYTIPLPHNATCSLESEPLYFESVDNDLVKVTDKCCKKKEHSVLCHEEFGQYVLPETIVHILNRKSPNVTCYALRRELNLRISSNQVEKANDFVVATRQKHI